MLSSLVHSSIAGRLDPWSVGLSPGRHRRVVAWWRDRGQHIQAIRDHGVNGAVRLKVGCRVIRYRLLPLAAAPRRHRGLQGETLQVIAEAVGTLSCRQRSERSPAQTAGDRMKYSGRQEERTIDERSAKLVGASGLCALSPLASRLGRGVQRRAILVSGTTPEQRPCSGRDPAKCNILSPGWVVCPEGFGNFFHTG